MSVPRARLFSLAEEGRKLMAAESIWTQQGIWRKGRRSLSGDVPYLFEKDKREIDRLNRQHFLLKLAAGGQNYFVPVTKPRRILDVASGTGIWGREVARHFGQAVVWNLDKDEAVYQQAQRVSGFFPRNWRFASWSYPAALPFADGFFDYVHARFMALVIPAAGWPAMIREMLRVVRPGGYIGLMEGGLYQTVSPTMNLLQEAGIRLLSGYGLEPNAGPRLAEWAREAGVVNLQQRQIVVGKTPKQREPFIENTCAAVRDASQTLLSAGAFSREGLEAMQDDLPLELKAVGITITFYAVYGQKPL